MLFSQNLKKKLFFATRDGSVFFVICFCAYQRPIMFLSYALGLPHIADYCVNAVILGWVGAPNERTPFRIHDVVVGFVDRCLSNNRNLAASN